VILQTNQSPTHKPDLTFGLLIQIKLSIIIYVSRSKPQSPFLLEIPIDVQAFISINIGYPKL
jgi:hypothetical protein